MVLSASDGENEGANFASRGSNAGAVALVNYWVLARNESKSISDCVLGRQTSAVSLTRVT